MAGRFGFYPYIYGLSRLKPRPDHSHPQVTHIFLDSQGIRNLQITFGETHLTHYGGMFLIQWFCKKLKIKWILQKYVTLPQQNNRYTTGELLLALLHTIIAGPGRLNSTRILQYNGSFQAIVGLRSFPNATALRRFLLRLTSRVLKQALSGHDRFRQKIFFYPKTPTSVILDLNSTMGARQAGKTALLKQIYLEV